MDRPPKVAFSDFRYIHQEEEYVFKDYESLYAFKLLMSHWIQAPFIRMARALEKRKEHKLERRHNLPKGHLAGIQYRCSRFGSYKSLAQAKASEFHHKKLHHEIQVALDIFVPQAVELYARHHRVQFALEASKLECSDTTYQIMEARYDKLPTHHGSGRIAAPSPSPSASAPPLIHEVQVHADLGNYEDFDNYGPDRCSG